MHWGDGMLLKSYPSLERKLCDFLYPFPDLINCVIVKQKQVNKRVKKSTIRCHHNAIIKTVCTIITNYANLFKRFESRRIISILKKEILHTITLGQTELVYMLRNAG